MPQLTNFLPFARSYWALPGQLLGGFYPGDRDDAVTLGKLNALLDCGVTQIINLMQATEGDHAGRQFISYEQSFLQLAAQRGIRAGWARHPIQDLSVPNPAQMTVILNEIDTALSRGGCVYVHCWGGRGRTGTVIGCWLARHGERHALGRLRELTAHARHHFPQVPETAQQQRFVSQWNAA
ncbi:MAG: protein-tyrosine phosphatase family protein [Prosthecobacter sp.]